MRFWKVLFLIIGISFFTFDCGSGGGGGGSSSGDETGVESYSEQISPSGSNARNPDVAMDNNGNAIIVWDQFNGSNNQIFMSKYRNGSWKHPSSLSDSISPSGSNAREPKVAMDDNGNTIIAWYQSNGSNEQIFMSEYRNGSWKHPSSLSDSISPSESNAREPKVAMDDNGNAIIVWKQQDGSNNQVFISEYRYGSWIHPSDLGDNISPSGSTAFKPNVAMDNNDDAIIAWKQTNTSGTWTYMSEYRNGSWNHSYLLSYNDSLSGNSTSGPDIAMDDNDNAIIVWNQYKNKVSRLTQIYISEYRNGIWTHPLDIDDYISLPGKYAREPKVAMDNSGNAIIVWAQDEEKYIPELSPYVLHFPQILRSEYRNGSWTHPASINDAINPPNLAPDGAWGPEVTMDNKGNAAIVWIQYDMTDISSSFPYSQIFKCEYRNGSWNCPLSIDDNISPSGDADNPSIVIDYNGKAIITWEQVAGGYLQIFKSK